MRFAKLWLPVVLWMSLIFMGSTDAMSGAHTSRFIGPIVKWFYPGVSEETLDTIHLLLRKGWHLTEYGVLGLWVWRALSAATPGPDRVWPWRTFVLTMIICALYACSDELHQAFVPSRGASVHDVALDTCGAGAGMFLRWAFGRWRGSW